MLILSFLLELDSVKEKPHFFSSPGLMDLSTVLPLMKIVLKVYTSKFI